MFYNVWLYGLIFNGLKDKIMKVLHKVELEDKNLLHKEFAKDTGLKICYGNKDIYTEWLEHRLVKNLPIQHVVGRSEQLKCSGCNKPLHDGLCGGCCSDLASGNY